jgi:hypothetical protein
MQTWHKFIAAIFVLAAQPANAQTTQERGADGVLYNVTRTTVPKTVLTTEVQTREETIYRPRYTTKYQTYQQTSLAPVTEYRLVARQKGHWNPFQQPYWAHSLEPVTRWEQRPATVHVPITTTDWSPEKRTTQVPVTAYKTVHDTIVTRVPALQPQTLGPPTRSGQTQVASRPTAGSIGGQRLDMPTTWGGERYRR